MPAGGLGTLSQAKAQNKVAYHVGKCGTVSEFVDVFAPALEKLYELDKNSWNDDRSARILDTFRRSTEAVSKPEWSRLLLVAGAALGGVALGGMLLLHSTANRGTPDRRLTSIESCVALVNTSIADFFATTACARGAYVALATTCIASFFVTRTDDRARNARLDEWRHARDELVSLLDNFYRDTPLAELHEGYNRNDIAKDDYAAGVGVGILLHEGQGETARRRKGRAPDDL
eukprot:TRINITY_DN20045_c0_g1_i1.p2 TRINITY_DN20045_c0_g1~~TRINITY_DN20045_c0_g1_i1.p2  ORF type:complete len:246 (+),score=50.40 TRINITY_DN20045_c0_g1_i1:45-740(+)